MYEYFIHKNSGMIVPRVKYCSVCGSENNLKINYGFFDVDFKCEICGFGGRVDSFRPDEWKPSVVLEQLGKPRYERNEEY